MKKKILFIPGIGEGQNDYTSIRSYANVVRIDWNKPRIYFGKPKVMSAFSMGCILACTHALQHRIETLVLCSMTPGVETLESLKAKEVIFLMGEEEKWATKDVRRLARTIPAKIKTTLIVIPGEGHKIKGKYKKTLIGILKKVA